MRGAFVLSALASQVWAMEPTHLANLSAVLHRWSAGIDASPEVMAAIHEAQAARAARAKSNAAVGGGIAVLSLAGVMSQKASMMQDISGGTSTEMFTQALNAAVADPGVAGIIIDIDSPGGSVFGCGELASAVFAARSVKPIYGYVNSLCASAAYWVGSQCSQLFATQGGQCGSVGAYMTHVDESAALDAAGIKPTFIAAGRFKTEANSASPLDAEARAFLQSQVDSYYAMFTSAVAKGRGVPVASVRDGFGQGRCLMASDCVSAGMIDGVCSFGDLVARMSKAIRADAGARAAAGLLEVDAETDLEPVAEVLPVPVAADPSPVVEASLPEAVELALVAVEPVIEAPAEPAAVVPVEPAQPNHAARIAARLREIELTAA